MHFMHTCCVFTHFLTLSLKNLPPCNYMVKSHNEEICQKINHDKMFCFGNYIRSLERKKNILYILHCRQMKIHICFEKYHKLAAGRAQVSKWQSGTWQMSNFIDKWYTFWQVIIINHTPTRTLWKMQDLNPNTFQKCKKGSGQITYFFMIINSFLLNESRYFLLKQRFTRPERNAVL